MVMGYGRADEVSSFRQDIADLKDTITKLKEEKEALLKTLEILVKD